MPWNAWRWLAYSSLIGCVCVLHYFGHAGAQGESPRRRAGITAPGATSPAAGATAKTPPQPLSQSTKITLDRSGLSVDVQDQDLPSVVERIASLGQIELRHPEGLPNRRVSIRFAALSVVEGLKRLFRVAEVPGYVLMTVKQGDSEQVQRIVFLAEEGAPTTIGARNTPRSPAVAAVTPPARPIATPVAPGTGPPAGTAPPPPPEAGAPAPPQTEEAKSGGGSGGASVFDDLKSNAAARRLLSQMMHPNEQVRERAFEGLVRLFREDDKQRALMEFLEPLMEDLTSEEKSTQDEAREELRKLLSR